ncbi:MAG TPA: asparagine synthase (glutamine-hydrolyzing), partial [Cytophagales bacterium]
MCGIHLILDKQSEPRPLAVGRMLAASSHRGPDAQGCRIVHSPRQVLSLGHNRLKITDPRDAANQPMATANGRYWLLFNGAIYNFRSLRHHLRHAYNFQTDSDTEVLLYWLVENGREGLSQLDGMYALAFYDCHTETLLLARDPWGMKPLFYAENDKYLVVSSEIRGVLASGLVAKEPELSQVAHYLRFKFAQRPGTFYRGVRELEPGTTCVSSPGKELSVAGMRPDESPAEAFSAPTRKDVLPRLTQALTETVARHLQADVPAGLLLSGGVDSALLLALAREAGVTDLPVFTVAYGGEDEAHATRDHHFARQAARQYGAAYHEVPVGRQLLESFWEWLPTLDQPVGDGAAWLTWLLAQEAKKHVKVVLSGAGADELFGGYHRH